MTQHPCTAGSFMHKKTNPRAGYNTKAGIDITLKDV